MGWVSTTLNITNQLKMLTVQCISPQRTHWMDVCADDLCDAPREEVPDDDASVVAAHRQQGPPPVECAGEGHADAVQSAICFLATQSRQRHSQGQSDDPRHHCGMDFLDVKQWYKERLMTYLGIVLPEGLWKTKKHSNKTQQTCNTERDRNTICSYPL